jgi:GxxExxY protein
VLVVELKSVEKVLPVHDAQVLTYMRLLGKTEGLLINFNVPLLKQGIKRFLLNENRLPVEPDAGSPFPIDPN